MTVTILILFMLFFLLSFNVRISIKSANDTIKIFGKVGFVDFFIPVQRIIDKQRTKSSDDQRKDLLKMLKKRKIIYYLCKHSSLDVLYFARFTKEELFVNPFSNGMYYILLNQIKGYVSGIFKIINEDTINLIYNNNYENIDYYVEIKTDVIGVIVSFIEFIVKGR